MGNCLDCARGGPLGGNGKCSDCGGTGKRALSNVNEGFFGEPLLCEKCGGSGDCPTCNGSGQADD